MADDKSTAPEMEAQVAPELESPTSDESEIYSKGDIEDLLKALRAERDLNKANHKALKEAKTQLAQLEGVDPELHARLVAESAKRAELEAETAARVQSIEKSYSDQLAAAKQQQEAASVQVQHLQKQWAFEKAFAEAGGRGGRFTELAFRELGDQVKLEPDGNLAVVDRSGAYVLEDGKRVRPSEWLKQYKSDEVVGYWFQAERGAGSGLMPQPGTALANGADMHSLKTSELFAQAFARKK
jgi:hypothetical protein